METDFSFAFFRGRGLFRIFFYSHEVDGVFAGMCLIKLHIKHTQLPVILHLCVLQVGRSAGVVYFDAQRESRESCSFIWSHMAPRFGFVIQSIFFNKGGENLPVLFWFFPESLGASLFCNSDYTQLDVSLPARVLPYPILDWQKKKKWCHFLAIYCEWFPPLPFSRSFDNRTMPFVHFDVSYFLGTSCSRALASSSGGGWLFRHHYCLIDGMAAAHRKTQARCQTCPLYLEQRIVTLPKVLPPHTPTTHDWKHIMSPPFLSVTTS